MNVYTKLIEQKEKEQALKLIHFVPGMTRAADGIAEGGEGSAACVKKLVGVG